MPTNNPPRPKRNKNSEAGAHSGAGLPTPSGRESASADLMRNVPPHSVEAEQAVLGGVFLRAESLDAFIDILQEEDFYLPAHQLIYRVFAHMSQESIPVDLVTTGETLKAMGLLEQAGGAAYLVELSRAIVSAANSHYYAEIVRDRALARRLISSCAEVISQSFEPGRDVKELLNDAEQAVFAISERTSGTTYKDAGTLTRQVFDDLARRAESRDLITGVTTGFHRLDEMTSGLQPSDLIILAARPAMGKTAFALNIAMRAAIRGGAPVAIFSLEMSMDQLITRMLCAWGKVNVSHLRGRGLNDEDWQGLHAAADHFYKAPIYIDDTPALSSLELRARTRRLKAQKNIGLVMVDYLQLMRASRRTDSREQEISDISRNLKAMAKELNIPVIALSQLNRKVEERSDKRPMLSDLRESGAIEQDADIIMFIYREAAYRKPEERPPVDEAEIIIAKHRNGPVGSVKLMYASSYTSFDDMAATYGPATDL